MFWCWKKKNIENQNPNDVEYRVSTPAAAALSNEPLNPLLPELTKK
jgi:hypothetical protein